MYHVLLLQSSLDGHMSYFHVGLFWIMLCQHCCINVSVPVFSSFGFVPRSGVPGYGISMFNFFLSPTVAVPLHISTSIAQGPHPIWFADIFSSSVRCFSIKLVVSFHAQNFLLLMKSNISIFTLVTCSFGVISQKIKSDRSPSSPAPARVMPPLLRAP